MTQRVPQKKLGSLIREGFWLGFLFTILAFPWIAYTLKEFGQIPWALAIAGLIGFAGIGEPHWMVLSPLLGFTLYLGLRSRMPWVALLAGSGFLAAIDWGFPKLFSNTLGHALVLSPSLAQVSDLGGPAGLTFLCALTNLALTLSIRSFRDREAVSFHPALRQILPLVLISLLVLVSAHFYGEKRIQEVSERYSSPDAKTYRISIIQANIGDLEKLASERGVRGAADRVLDIYYRMSDEALAVKDRPDALLWPETSYPSTFRMPETSHELKRDQQLVEYVRTRQTALWFGGYDRDRVHDYNAFFFLENEVLQTYRKHIPLWFGEILPFSDQFPILRQWFPMVANFGRGPGAQSLQVLGGLKVSPSICYEALFPGFIRGSVRAGAQAQINVTNDSWFGTYSEPEHHLRLASLRAIETRTPMVRSTNTGISVLIGPTGQVEARSKLGVPEILPVALKVLPKPPETLFVRFGDWFGWAGLGLGVLGLLALSLKLRKTYLSD
jgi:apolipoprotein N-acyltransferase